MKKFLIALLALVMMFALAIPALADDYNTSGNVEQEVTAGYTAAEDVAAAPVYRVTIEWTPVAGDPALTYVGEKTTYTWDTEGLKYKSEVTEEAGWTGETGYTVKVTNYSNAEVDAAVEARANYNLTVEKTHASDAVTLKSAAVDSNGDAINYTETEKTGNAQTETFTYTYKDGGSATAPTGVSSDKVTIGTITVTIG